VTRRRAASFCLVLAAVQPGCARVFVPGTDAGAPFGTDAAGSPADATPGADGGGLPGTDAAPPPGTDAAPAVFCGNFIIEPPETCDDGNDGDQTDDCLLGCIAAFCGDGYLQVGVEACDDGNDGDQTNACLDGCAAASCGDGFLWAGVEACDDGNLVDGDGCSSACVIEPYMCAGTPFGPDAYGYMGCARFPATVPCADISTTGTAVVLGDDSSISVPLGFSFDLYGTIYTAMNVGSNGKLVPISATYTNACLPSGEGDAIYPWWDDLYPPGGGSVTYATAGTAPDRTFEVQWVIQHFAGTTGTIDVRVVLHETSNRIVVCYVDTTFATADDNGASATAGIQSATSSLQYSCNSAVLTPGLVLRYDHP
jgi:cysteine-rich repeat protein